MKFYIEELSRLEVSLEQLELERLMIYNRAEKGISLCRNSIHLMRERVLKYGFKNDQEECEFFKTVKPVLVGYLIHFINLVYIERHRPIGCCKEKHNFYIEQISSLRAYFIEERELYEYYIRGLAHRDMEFFYRNILTTDWYCNSITAMVDANFSTAKDMILAQIIGNTYTINYLKRKLVRKKKKPVPNIKNANVSGLKWTGSKVDLVELVYALQASGMINYGNAGIKELAKGVEKFFSIEVGDYYRIFLEIRSRKNSQYKLLDRLKSSLQNKIIEADA